MEKYTEIGQDIQKELDWRETRSTIWQNFVLMSEPALKC